MPGFHITISDADIVAHRVTLLQSGTQVGEYDYADAAVVYVPSEPDDPPAPQPTMRTFELGASGPGGTYWIDLGLDGTYDVEHRSIDDGGNVSAPLAGVLSVDFVAPGVATNFDPF